jgi:hypothetical protein
MTPYSLVEVYRLLKERSAFTIKVRVNQTRSKNHKMGTIAI